MSKEEKHLQTKIRIFEDMLLRCKNFGQAEAIQIELTKANQSEAGYYDAQKAQETRRQSEKRGDNV